MENERQKYLAAFQAAGWEVVAGYRATKPNAIHGRYEVPVPLGGARRQLVIEFDPDLPPDPEGNITIHDVFRGVFARTHRVLTPQEALQVFRHDR